MDIEPFVDEDSDHDVCWICPSVRFPAGGFDVFERPTRECPFDPADGFRYTAAGVPVCVHPYKVGLPPGRYASDGEPVPACAPRSASLPPSPVADTAAARQDGPGRAVAAAAACVLGSGPGSPVVRSSAGGSGAPSGESRERRSPAPYAGVIPPGLPDELGGLAAWVGELARDAAPEDLAEVLAGAEAAALTRFPETEVLAVLRRVLSGG